LLDLGSGYGRLAFGLKAKLFDGQYFGIDILKRHVNWCQANITPIDSSYQFEHMDVKNDRYNPEGRWAAENWEADFAANSFDFVCAFSVFTHMYETEISNYLQQVNKILKPNGLCLATFFLYDQDRLTKVTSPKNGLCMRHKLNGHTLYHSCDDPLHAIAYERQYIKSMITRNGFELVKLNYGKWAGGENSYQDFLVIRKPSKGKSCQQAG
jgi:SAM-dependent methyltransferase